ncbi:MAG: hypothetical protein AAF589_03425 [Planctomycetota bacterium]
MIGWLFNVYRRWRADRRRLIFKYWDGTRRRRADPYRLYRAMQDHPTFNFSDPATMDLVAEGCEPEFSDCVAALGDVFDCRSLDESGGLTAYELLGLLTNYNRFCEESESFLDGGPTSSSSMDGGLSSAEAAPSATTDSYSASGAAGSERPPASPPPATEAPSRQPLSPTAATATAS